MRGLQKPAYYGWYMVMIAGLGVFFSGPGQTYFISVFIDQYITDFGWSRSEVSSIYSAATLASAACLFFVGRLIDRFGQRAMMVIASILLAIACLFNSYVTSLTMLFFGIWMLRLFGQGSMTLIPNTLVPQWFITKRGQALSYMAIGGFLSSAVFPPLNVWLVGLIGWQTTWQVWGLLVFVMFTPLAYRFVRNRPEDMGLLPDGGTNPHPGNKSTTAPLHIDIDFTFQEALKTRAFWLILSCIGIPALVNTAITFHLISIFEEQSLPPVTAAIVLSLMAILGFPVTFIAGRIIDVVKINYVLIGIFVTEIVFMIILQYTSTFSVAMLFGVIWGISNGFERIALNYVWPYYFGRAALGSISGLATSVMVLGSAVGPLPFGIAYDLFGNYESIIWYSLVFPVIGILAASFAVKPTLVR